MNNTVRNPNSYTLKMKNSGPDVMTIIISGTINLDTVNDFMVEVDRLLDGNSGRNLIFDFKNLDYMDSAGALAFMSFRDKAKQKSITLRYDSISAEAERILALVDFDIHEKENKVQKTMPVFLERVGHLGIHSFNQAILLCLFIGDVASAFIQSVIHPGTIRWDNVSLYMKKAGVEGLPIIGLISILLGLIMAFMASLQLRLFGANIYIASLVAIALVKELGPIMTAIVYAGRSGSAFSSEIGTMLINDEVDALSTMGFDPIKFLVLPKIIASIAVVPILTCYSSFLGILGGLFVGLGMDLTVQSYMQQTMQSIQLFDVVTSLFKSVCFAVLVSAISCHRGFQAKGGAEAVGTVTTSAVVSSIFLIIIADSAFAIMLHYIR